MLSIALLGQVEVREGDRVVPCGGGKQRALLARLALAEGRPLSTAALIDDLWGQHLPADPAHALQAHVSRLRSVLPVQIARVAAGYQLPVDEVDLDVTRFTALHETGRERLTAGDHEAASRLLDEALSLWRGPAFLDLPEVPGLQPIAVHLDELWHTALADRTDAYLARGRTAEVLPELRSLLAEYPLRERAWRQLMTALYRDGREGEALTAYQSAREVFIDQLGAEPGPRLAEVHRAILERTLPERAAPQQPETGCSADPPAEPPPALVRAAERSTFAGRARELETLERLWRESGPRLVAVTGEPGIGKTRLAAEFGLRRTRDGVRVLFGRCDQSLTIPYQPFKELIREDLAVLSDAALPTRLGNGVGELLALFPELADRLAGELPSARSSGHDSALHRTFDAVAGWLAAASSQEPLLLVLDDLQWADRQSLLLLRHLTRSPRTIDAMIVVTFRDREPACPESIGRLLAELTRQSEITTHLPLAGLDRAEVTDLLSHELSDDGDNVLERDLPGEVLSASGGNPLFLVELARQRRQGVGESELPSGLRDVVGRRLHSLEPEPRALLECAAVVGRSFDPLVVRDAAAIGDHDLDAFLEAATYARLIVPSEGAVLRCSFSHDVVRTVLYEAVPPLRRARLHRAVAEAIMRRSGEGREQYAELAHHYSAATPAGTGRQALRFLRLAGEEALEQRAPSVAVEHFRRADQLLPASAAARADLLTRLGIAEFRSGDASFRETLLTAGRLAARAGDSEVLTAAVLANNRGWWSSTAQADVERIQLIEAALASHDTVDRHAHIELLLAWALENVRDPEQRERSLERSAQALALAEEVADEDLVATALAHRISVLYASFGDPKGIVELSERLFDIARRRGEPGLRLDAAVGLAQSTLMVGELAVAGRALAQATQLAGGLNQPARLWLARCWEAMLTATHGDLEMAEKLAVEAYQLGEQTAQPDALTWFAGQLFTFRMLGGRLDELVDDIEAQVSSQALGIPSWQAAWALTLVRVGRHPEAADVLDQFAVDDFAGLPQDMLWLHGMSYLSEVCVGVGDRAAARAVFEALSPHSGLMAHNGTIDAGPVDLHLGRLAGFLGLDEQAEHLLDSANQLCRRIRAPLWLDQVAELQTR